jgi:anaerobic magnesium-protoporphyrin IX monomethyl ester cyclase
MKLRDVVYLIVKPFLGNGRGPTKSEVLSRAVEHGAIKDAAADLTQVADGLLEYVMTESRAERRRIEADAGAFPSP